MKTARIINATIWAIIAIAVIVCTCISWSAQGAGTVSMLAAVVFYSINAAGLAYVIDQTIQGK